MKKRVVRLNGLYMPTKEKAHRYIKRKLGFPDWYGANLDALNDCLGEIGEPTRIVLCNAHALRRNLGDYGVKLVTLLLAAQDDNPCVSVLVRPRSFLS